MAFNYLSGEPITSLEAASLVGWCHRPPEGAHPRFLGPLSTGIHHNPRLGRRIGSVKGVLVNPRGHVPDAVNIAVGHKGGDG